LEVGPRLGGVGEPDHGRDHAHVGASGGAAERAGHRPAELPPVKGAGQLDRVDMASAESLGQRDLDRHGVQADPVQPVGAQVGREVLEAGKADGGDPPGEGAVALGLEQRGGAPGPDARDLAAVDGRVADQLDAGPVGQRPHVPDPGQQRALADQ
jgi:hypothetical protein